jgi:4a-hydroxytetrahydrobiopterin dehydratase
MTTEQLHEHLSTIPDWQVVEEGGVKRLVKSFKFADFNEAMEFSCKVWKLAESEGHHPVILTEWGKTTVTWWSHEIGGLHLNDVIMAAKTDHL